MKCQENCACRDYLSFNVSGKTNQFIEKQSDWLTTIIFLSQRFRDLNVIETKVIDV